MIKLICAFIQMISLDFSMFRCKYNLKLLKYNDSKFELSLLPCIIALKIIWWFCKEKNRLWSLIFSGPNPVYSNRRLKSLNPFNSVFWFAFFRKNKWIENAKCENFVKPISDITRIVNFNFNTSVLGWILLSSSKHFLENPIAIY